MSAFRPDGWTTPELAQAVERGQLELHYQPVVDLRSGGIVGAEALLRWRHPTLGLLPPGQFLPVVESSGLMPEIGAWVLGEACRQMRDWRMLAWRPFRLAVNVSASQVGPDFDGWGKGVLADAELPAEAAPPRPARTQETARSGSGRWGRTSACLPILSDPRPDRKPGAGFRGFPARSTLDRLRGTSPDSAWDVGRAMSELCGVLLQRGAYDKAEPLLVDGFESLGRRPRRGRERSRLGPSDARA